MDSREISVIFVGEWPSWTDAKLIILTSPIEIVAISESASISGSSSLWKGNMLSSAPVLGGK